MTIELLGYGYSVEALHALADYGVHEVRSGRATDIRFGILDSQVQTLRTYMERIAGDVRYTISPPSVVPLRIGANGKPMYCPCCGRKL